MNRAEREKELHRITREIADRAYAIWRQPWRFRRNRRLRQEIAALMKQSGASR